MRHLFFLLMIPLFLCARENPFFPVDDAMDLPLTSNHIDGAKRLKRATITLPSTARTIESISVEYKNLDGSIATKKIELHNAIDWHLPLFISQNYNESQKESSALNKKHTVYKKIINLPFISFYKSGKRLKIITKDKMLRNFLLVKPHRIVCDFKHQTNFRSYIKKLPNSSFFKKIRLGTHKGYYRVVIELDGYYQYKVKKIASGYLFILL